MNVSKRDRAQYIEIADFLTDYNEGVIGPGHCFEVLNTRMDFPNK